MMTFREELVFVTGRQDSSKNKDVGATHAQGEKRSANNVSDMGS